jgi:hypothetical protein
MIGMGMRNKRMLANCPAVIKSDIQVRKQNTVMARFFDIHH